MDKVNGNLRFGFILHHRLYKNLSIKGFTRNAAPHEIIFPLVYRYEGNETFVYFLIIVKATERVFENEILLISMEGRYLIHERPMFLTR